MFVVCKDTLAKITSLSTHLLARFGFGLFCCEVLL